MLGLGSNREILRVYFQRRLFLAGAHAARPRYPCRLRAAEIRDRKIVGAGAAGAARDGDDGMMFSLLVRGRESASRTMRPEMGPHPSRRGEDAAPQDEGFWSCLWIVGENSEWR